MNRRELALALGPLYLGYALLFLATGSLQQVTIPLLKNTRPWDTDLLYWVMPALYFTQALSRLPITHVIKRLGMRVSLVAGSLSYLVAAVAITLAPRYWMVIAGMVLWGFGSAGFWAAGAAHLLNTTQRGRYGRFSGSLFAAVDVGFIVGVPLLSLIAARAGYQWIWAFVVPVSALGTLALAFVPVRAVGTQPASVAAFREAMARPWGRTAAVLLFFAAFSFGTTLGIMSEHTAARYGAGPVALLTFFYVARILTNIFGGRLSDRVGRAPVLAGAFALAAGGAGLTAWSNGAAALLPVGSAALGMVFAAVPLTALALVGDHAAEEKRPVVYGALFVWRDTGVGCSVLLGHYLREWLGDFSQAMWIFAAVWLVLALFSFAIRPHARLGKAQL